MTLWDIDENVVVRVESICSDLHPEYRRRLEELGFGPSARITCQKRLPLGGPILIEVFDAVFALTRDLAGAVRVSFV